MDAAGLVMSSQTTLVVTTACRIVDADVTNMFLAHLLNCVFYRSTSNRLVSICFSGKIGKTTPKVNKSVFTGEGKQPPKLTSLCSVEKQGKQPSKVNKSVYK